MFPLLLCPVLTVLEVGRKQCSLVSFVDGIRKLAVRFQGGFLFFPD